jgi:hypothetical protein
MSGWARSAWIRFNQLSFTGFGPYSGPLAGRGVWPFGVTDEGPSRVSAAPTTATGPRNPGARLLARLLSERTLVARVDLPAAVIASRRHR